MFKATLDLRHSQKAAMIQTQPAACQCAWLRQRTFHEQFILLFRRECFRVVNFIIVKRDTSKATDKVNVRALDIPLAHAPLRVTFHALHLLDTDKR